GATHHCYRDLYVHVKMTRGCMGAVSTPSIEHAGRAARSHKLHARLGVEASDERYKWWALSCTSLGMLLAATNSGTLIIALPDLEGSLHTSLLSLVWVIHAYLIAPTVTVLGAGRLSHLFGGKRAYLGRFPAFTL